MLSLRGLIDADKVSQYAVVNQNGAAVPAEAELLPAVADAFDNVTIHAASLFQCFELGAVLIADTNEVFPAVVGHFVGAVKPVDILLSVTSDRASYC